MVSWCNWFGIVLKLFVKQCNTVLRAVIMFIKHGWGIVNDLSLIELFWNQSLWEKKMWFCVQSLGLTLMKNCTWWLEMKWWKNCAKGFINVLLCWCMKLEWKCFGLMCKKIKMHKVCMLAGRLRSSMQQRRTARAATPICAQPAPFQSRFYFFVLFWTQ